MDPYIDAIPDDRGEEIKNRVRDRDSSESPPSKRPRADTGALLAPEGDGDDAEGPLKPQANLYEYDRERLQKGLVYVTGAAKRNVTPRTHTFLKLHKDAYKAALDGGAPVEASRAVVQAMDEPRSLEEHEHFMHYVKLRRLELLANYGDYLGQELQQIRADLNAAATDADDSKVREAALELGPPKTWLTMADRLAGADVGDLSQHVYTACGILGIEPEHMVWLIQEWGDRNRIFHNQIRQYISNCHWASLAEQVCRDVKELVNVAPDPDTAAKYERVLVSIKDEYFEVLSRDDPQHWLPNAKARKLTQGKSGEGGKAGLELSSIQAFRTNDANLLSADPEPMFSLPSLPSQIS
ncbi:MAG: hypothetical protein LQ338_003248, partial [Usnochroma carphineum]